MSEYGQRCREICVRRFRALVCEWLTTLPVSGWHGTGAELFEALEAYRVGRCKYPHGVSVYPNVAAKLREFQPAIRAAGWQATFSRTRSARFITFARLKTAKR